MSEDYPIRPFLQWPTDEDWRWIHAGNTFGAHLMKRVNDAVAPILPTDATDREREIAEKIRTACVFTMMEILDGYYQNAVGDSHSAEYVLLSRIVDNQTGNVCETIELAPDGDGLGMGYFGWQAGDFGQKEWE